MKLKSVLELVIIVLLALGSVFVITFLLRQFSNATTMIIIKSPKPGIECATMVTSDGAAIDCCWYCNVKEG